LLAGMQQGTRSTTRPQADLAARKRSSVHRPVLPYAGMMLPAPQPADERIMALSSHQLLATYPQGTTGPLQHTHLTGNTSSPWHPRPLTSLLSTRRPSLPCAPSPGATASRSTCSTARSPRTSRTGTFCWTRRRLRNDPPLPSVPPADLSASTHSAPPPSHHLSLTLIYPTPPALSRPKPSNSSASARRTI